MCTILTGPAWEEDQEQRQTKASTGGNIDSCNYVDCGGTRRKFVASRVKKPGFLKKAQSSGFFGFYWVFWTSRKK